MPILIVLKDPRINLIAEGEIDDKQIKAWDEIFSNQILMFKSKKGRNTVVPLLQQCNIAIMEEMTDKEVEEMEERSKKKQEEDGGGSSFITKPSFGFPAGGRKRH